MKLPIVLSEGFLQAMPEAERKRMGKAGMTQAEAQAVFQRGEEKKLQREVANYLSLKGCYFIQSRMDKRTTNKCGTPDFLAIVSGMALAIECKVESQTLTKEQAAEAARIRRAGGKFVICFSLQDCIEAVSDMNAL